ncbi:hypothetical protein CMI47_15795 [Candidatus Pacearchaeota archaeon]|nr:hypothetical protein [Candidatus Pacearchaeota archaeon]
MAHTINNRSKRMLDILVESNVDISKLSILRKTAADWTREEAEKKLSGESESSTGSFSYTLGTFFERPMMGGVPAYELYPDLGLAAAKKLIDLYKEEDSRSVFHTLMTKEIVKKVPEVAQDIVNFLIENADTFNYVEYKYHETHPEALEPLLRKLLATNPNSYFYFKNSREGRTGPVSDLVNRIDLREEERLVIGGIIEGLEGAEPKYGTPEYNILFENNGWMSNPEASEYFMERYVKSVSTHRRGAEKYLEAYPEKTKASLRQWAAENPKEFINSNLGKHDVEALSIALSELTKKDPAKYFYTMYLNGKREPEIYYSDTIDHHQNISTAVKTQMEEGWDYQGRTGPDYFLQKNTDTWPKVMESVGYPQDPEVIRDNAMKKTLENIQSLRASFADPDYEPSKQKADAFQSIILRLFSNVHGSIFNLDIVNNFPEYLDNPIVIELAEFYARGYPLVFFESDVYKHFPESGRNHILNYIKNHPINFFKKELHKEFPDFIQEGLEAYKKVTSRYDQPGAVIDINIRERLFGYFDMGLDDLDTEEGRAEEVRRIFEKTLEKSIKDGIAAKYPEAFINFAKSEGDRNRLYIDSVNNPDYFFQTKVPEALREISNEDDYDFIENGIIKEFAQRLAAKDPLSFFSRQINGQGNFFHRYFMARPVSIESADDERERIAERVREREENDESLIIANLYPQYREIALNAFIKVGDITSFYNAIREFNIEISIEDEEAFLKKLIYGKRVDQTSHLISSPGNPSLNVAKLFKYMKVTNDYSIKEKFPELLRKAAHDLAATHPLSFKDYGVNELYPDIKYAKLSALRQIDDREKAMHHFDNSTSALVSTGLPNHIKVNSSIYQEDQRPDEWEDSERFTISQNNTNPTDLMYGINKKLIHAGDGVAHTNVGASGFTSAWALTAIHGTPRPAEWEQTSESDNDEYNMKILSAVQDLKTYFWMRQGQDPDEDALRSLEEKGVPNYLGEDSEDISRFYEAIETPLKGHRTLSVPPLGRAVKIIDRKVGIPDNTVGGLVYILIKHKDSERPFWRTINDLKLMKKELANIFRPIINIEGPDDDRSDDEGEEVNYDDFPESALVIEQYQSDYPVVYDRIFLGNLRGDDGNVTGKEYDQLNNMIMQNLDIEAAKAWLNKSRFAQMFEAYNPEIIEGEVEEDAFKRKVEEFFLNNEMSITIFDMRKEHLPAELSPDVKDARKHFDIITKVYPYLVIINTIEVAKRLNHKYIYIMRNAPYYANIQNEQKAIKLYQHIPELVATERSLGQGLEVANVETHGSRQLYESVYEVPANDESIAILRTAAERISGQGPQYDFSLTPLQNRANKETPKKKMTWSPTPEKIERLKELTGAIKLELEGVDVPELYDPVGAIKYLTKEVRSKIIPKKRFSRVFGPIIGELGKLSRASRLERLINEMFIKTSSETSPRRKALRKFLILNAMNAATN